VVCGGKRVGFEVQGVIWRDFGDKSCKICREIVVVETEATDRNNSATKKLGVAAAPYGLLDIVYRIRE